jgi:hypothetical protein
MIFAAMLGITNHWISFVAEKSLEGTSYFVLDSRNRDYLQWTEPQMKEFIKEENIVRKNTGREPWNDFYQGVQLQCMKDIQQCVCLMVELLSGLCTIDTFACNSRMRVFLNPLINRVAFGVQEFMQLQITPQTMEFLYENFYPWADEYYHTTW